MPTLRSHQLFFFMGIKHIVSPPPQKAQQECMLPEPFSFLWHDSRSSLTLPIRWLCKCSRSGEGCFSLSTKSEWRSWPNNTQAPLLYLLAVSKTYYCPKLEAPECEHMSEWRGGKQNLNLKSWGLTGEQLGKKISKGAVKFIPANTEALLVWRSHHVAFFCVYFPDSVLPLIVLVICAVSSMCLDHIAVSNE